MLHLFTGTKQRWLSLALTSRLTHKVEFRTLVGLVLMPPLTDILPKTLVVELLGAVVAGVGVAWGYSQEGIPRFVN